MKNILNNIVIVSLLIILYVTSCTNNTQAKESTTTKLYPPVYGEWVKMDMPNQTGFHRCFAYYVNDNSIEKSIPRLFWCKE